MKKKTHDEFVNDVSILNSEIDVLGKYINNKTKLDVRCKICGHIWSSRPDNILHGYGCPKCAGQYQRNHDEFILDIKSINPNIEICSKFKNVSTKIKVKCNICNHSWEVTPNHLLQGIGCPKCKSIKIGNIRRISHDEFMDRVHSLNLDIEILSSYEHSLSKVKCKCLVCGKVWYATPANLLNGHGCPYYSESKGEKKIADYLMSRKIEFYAQKKFDGLVGVNNGLLSYDFYLPNENILIEYQGIQHEKPVNFSGKTDYAERQFCIQKEHDKRKREYAINNNLTLIEIWYFDFDNIDSILFQLVNR